MSTAGKRDKTNKTDKAGITDVASLVVHPYTFRVERHAVWAQTTKNLGNTDADSLLIMLDANQPDIVETETLFHEAIHAIWAQTGLAKNYKSSEEEEIIWALTPRLLAFLRDNPRFAEVLTDAT